MTFNEWWHHTGSGIAIAPDHDIEEHTRYVTGICWNAARAAIYEAEAAQLTQGLRTVNADLLAALESVRDYWAGGDCPPALWGQITQTIARAKGEHNTLDAFARAAVSRITRGD